MTSSLLSRVGLIALIAIVATPAAAFTYDTHVDRTGGAAFRDPDASSSGPMHFSISGGGGSSAPASGPFLNSSNPNFSSPVASWSGGAFPVGPRFLNNR